MILNQSAPNTTLYTGFNEESARQLPPSLPAILKAALCLLPHFLFRSTSLVLLAAFLRLHALIPILSYGLVILIITLSIPHISDTLPNFLMVLFTPMVFTPHKSSNRRLLELSLLAAPLVLLPSLLVLFLLPHLATEDSLLAALPHSLYNSTVPLCPSPTGKPLLPLTLLPPSPHLSPSSISLSPLLRLWLLLPDAL